MDVAALSRVLMAVDSEASDNVRRRRRRVSGRARCAADVCRAGWQPRAARHLDSSGRRTGEFGRQSRGRRQRQPVLEERERR